MIQILQQKLEVAAPIHGVRIGRRYDKSTWEIDFKDEATKEQRVAAQSILDAFDPDAPPVPATITPRQMLLGLMSEGLITENEALAAAKTGDVPAAVQDIFDALPTSAERVTAAITWARMSVVERDNPLVAALAAANNMSNNEADAFFVACAKL